ncbi:claspin isoform X1 [Rousettus aegyptiacus]|uniref:claspin isoform X1 n=1 Tax=Rousettus aegyptiacus TaxID=9407 RepID=UPI00168CC13D|nr:claspin isoform X1 [Rousettus aegyptiacus]
MTAEVASEVHLEVSDPKLISQEEADSPSDSGQGSCETIGTLSERDSDEEIFVSKKLKSRKVLHDSDSEREDTNASPEETTYDSVEEENKENLYAGRNGKVRRIYKTLADSDESDIEASLYRENLETQVTPCLEVGLQSENSVDFTVNRKISKTNIRDKEGTGGKAKVKSKRRLEKEERKMEKIRRLKKKETKNKEDNVKQPFNDSGCLLVDKDLFETGLEEESNSPLEDEESLESIRAAVKSKVKKHKKKELSLDSGVSSFEEASELSKGTMRKERKAAKLSKEALKKLHSETQRLIRESALNLPYHMPENKTIHDFFKRKPRPTCQGNAMALLKSSKYQLSHYKEITDTANTTEIMSDHHSKDSEQTTGTGYEMGINALPAVSKELQTTAGSDESCSQDLVGSEVLEIQEKQKQSGARPSPGDSSVAQQESSFLRTEDNEGYQTGGLVVPELDAPEGEEGLKKTEEADEKVEEPRQQTKSAAVVPSEKARKFTLDRLKQLGVDVFIKPRLGADEDSFVTLEEPEANRELEALKQRFWKHANPAVKPRAGQKVNVNIVVKDVGTDGKEELKADVVPVTLAAEKLDEVSHTKPGEKLLVLKAKLQEAMKLRRFEERQKRQALFKLDNEDGFEEEEEEEEEMTDESEEDGEEEEEEKLEEGEEKKEEEEEEGNQEVSGNYDAEFLLSNEEIETKDEKEMEKENNDDSSETGKSVGLLSVLKPLSSDSTLLLFKDNSSKMGYFPGEEKSETDENSGKRTSKLDEDDSCSLLTKESSHNSSFELIGSTIPSYQPCNRQIGRGTSFFPTAAGFRSPSPGLFRASLVSSASKSSGKLSEPSLPIEDSQDLYNASPEPKTLFLGAGDFQFCLEDDTQSQLLDADGFLNVRNHRNQYQALKPRLPLASMDENAMDANMDELLDLCTGKFTSQAEKALPRKNDKKENMEELLNLCSGKFSSQDVSTLAPSELNKQEKESSIGDPMEEALALCSGSFPTDREEEGEEEEFGDFRLVPNDNEFDSDQDESSDSDNEDVAAEDYEDDDEEELLKQSERLKRKMRLKKYLEDEAEVSGSDVGSEDEYDGEEIDEYEEDVIDEVLPSDEELQSQIKKIHMKTMLDDDKRQLRLYQERYLADGDLHSDGPGRMRKFRWKNIDDASQMDLFHRDSDDEQIEEQLDETEARWRKERIEREQWLRDQAQQGKIAAEEEEEIGEDSQFMILAKKVTAKALQKNANRTVVIEETKSLLRNPFEAIRPESAHQLKTGSLLNQPKAVLQKLAALSDLNPSAPRNLRKFVFHTLSPVKAEATKESPKPQVRRKATSLMKTPSPKRLKTGDRTSELKQSIFRYLES